MIILFMLLIWGLSNIIATEFIFYWLRRLAYKTRIKSLHKLITCPNCLSVWFGFGISFLLPLPVISCIIVNNFIWAIIGYSFVKLMNIYLSDKDFRKRDEY